MLMTRLRSARRITAAAPVLIGFGLLTAVSAPSAYASSCRQAVSVAIAPAHVVYGDKAVGTVKLRCRLGSHGASVSLKRSWTGFSTPKSVWVSARSTTAHFAVRTNDRVSAPKAAHVSASLGRLHASGAFTITPHPTISSFTVSPDEVVSGHAATGTVRLSSIAAAAGYHVRLQSSDPHVVVPDVVTVASQHTTVSFSVTSTDAHQPTAAEITANGRSLWLTVDSENPGVATVYVPGPTTDVRPDHPLTGRVNLAGTAHGPGVQVTLTSSNPDVVLPPSVTVPAGATYATFEMTARVQSERVYGVVITASANGISQTTNVVLLPPGDLRHIGDATLVENGTTAQKTVELSYSRDTDTVVSLTSDDPAVTVPATVTVPAGQKTATFPVTVGTLPLLKRVTITATLGEENLTGVFLAGPNAPRSVYVGPKNAPAIVAGQPVVGDVMLYGQAAPGGATVSLTSDDPHLVLPPTIQVPAGRSSGSFVGTTSGPLAADITVTVTVSLNGQSAGQQLVIKAHP
jgi:trimeric autotransporter adhesin